MFLHGAFLLLLLLAAEEAGPSGDLELPTRGGEPRPDVLAKWAANAPETPEQLPSIRAALPEADIVVQNAPATKAIAAAAANVSKGRARARLSNLRSVKPVQAREYW